MVDMVIQSLFLKSSIPLLGKDWGVGHGHTEPSSEKLSTSSRTGKGWCAGLVLSLPHRSSALSLLGKGRVPHIVPEDRVDGVCDHDHELCLRLTREQQSWVASLLNFGAFTAGPISGQCLQDEASR